MVGGLQHFGEREGEGKGQPLLHAAAFAGGDAEELMHVQPDVAIAVGNLPPESPGTLYISTRRVIWLSDTDRSKGYAVDFLSVSLHAVSRDPEAYPSPCIYAQIETETGENEELEDSDTENDDAELSKVTEMRLVPSDPGQLDSLFKIFCDCAELNPDPIEEEEEENEWFFGGEQMVENGEDPDWHFSEELANPIGYGNGHLDLASSVLEAVRRDNKQRFSLLEENGELLIRANQGHTITTVSSESLLMPILSADEVPVSVHGTYRRNLESILESGLKRMARLHVHFSRGLPTDGEVISGMRRNVDILIFLDVRKALEDGMKLYISDNKVILTEGFDGVVPVKYFEKIETWPRREPIPFTK